MKNQQSQIDPELSASASDDSATRPAVDPRYPLGTGDLDDLWLDLWTRLVRGAADGRHAFHTPAFATVDAGVPHVRTVVLRTADPQNRQLICHTDARSPKVGQIARHPIVSWLFYDSACKLQLRVRASAVVLFEGPTVETRWQATPVMSRRCYLAPQAPGLAVDRPHPNLDPPFDERNPTVPESESGRAHFAVIVTSVTEIDWLYLAANGHRRARYTLAESGIESTWVLP